MALDRFIRFKDKTPSVESIAALLRNYIGSDFSLIFNAGTEVDHWSIKFGGKTSFALKFEWPKEDPYGTRDRWIEVFRHREDKRGVVVVDVVTRQMDEFTCALADGLVVILARVWNGKVDPG